MNKEMTTKEAIAHCERRAKKLEILAMTKNDKTEKGILQRAAEKAKELAERMRNLGGHRYHRATKNFD